MSWNDLMQHAITAKIVATLILLSGAVGFHLLLIITVPIERDANWQQAEEALLRAANEVCAPYLEKARSYMKGLERQHSLDAPGVEPRVQIQLPDPKWIDLVLRTPIPARRRGRMEQEIIKRYLVNWQEAQKSVEESGDTRAGTS